MWCCEKSSVVSRDAHSANRKSMGLNFKYFFKRRMVIDLDWSRFMFFWYSCKNGSSIVHYCNLRYFNILLISQGFLTTLKLSNRSVISCWINKKLFSLLICTNALEINVFDMEIFMRVWFTFIRMKLPKENSWVPTRWDEPIIIFKPSNWANRCCMAFECVMLWTFSCVELENCYIICIVLTGKKMSTIWKLNFITAFNRDVFVRL